MTREEVYHHYDNELPVRLADHLDVPKRMRGKVGRVTMYSYDTPDHGVRVGKPMAEIVHEQHIEAIRENT